MENRKDWWDGSSLEKEGWEAFESFAKGRKICRCDYPDMDPVVVDELMSVGWGGGSYFEIGDSGTLHNASADWGVVEIIDGVSRVKNAKDIKYVLHREVICNHDGRRKHYISYDELIELHGLNKSDCQKYASWLSLSPDVDTATHLYPPQDSYKRLFGHSDKRGFCRRSFESFSIWDVISSSDNVDMDNLVVFEGWLKDYACKHDKKDKEVEDCCFCEENDDSRFVAKNGRVYSSNLDWRIVNREELPDLSDEEYSQLIKYEQKVEFSSYRLRSDGRWVRQLDLLPYPESHMGFTGNSFVGSKEIEEALEQGRKDREEFDKYNQVGRIDPSIRFRG